MHDWSVQINARLPYIGWIPSWASPGPGYRYVHRSNWRVKSWTSTTVDSQVWRMICKNNTCGMDWSASQLWFPCTEEYSNKWGSLVAKTLCFNRGCIHKSLALCVNNQGLCRNIKWHQCQSVFNRTNLILYIQAHAMIAVAKKSSIRRASHPKIFQTDSPVPITVIDYRNQSVSTEYGIIKRALYSCYNSFIIKECTKWDLNTMQMMTEPWPSQCEWNHNAVPLSIKWHHNHNQCCSLAQWLDLITKEALHLTKGEGFSWKKR